MSCTTFGMACDALGAAVAKEDTALQTAIPVPQRVAVCMWRLATGEPLCLNHQRSPSLAEESAQPPRLPSLVEESA
jgi:hypothetical protein